MPFETFKRQRAAPERKPAVTIQKKGVFALNRAAYEALGTPDAVELLYDSENALVGIRKVDPTTPHGYAIRAARSGMSWLLSGMAFTQYYGIETPVARRWLARMENDVLVFDLKAEGVEVSSNRTRRKA